MVRKLEPLVVGKCIEAFSATWPRQVYPSVSAVRRSLEGQKITGLRRRAKLIVFDLGDATSLLVHPRMSGRFEWRAGLDNQPKHVRAIFDLGDGGSLFFIDARKFGRIRHVEDFYAATAHLGPEPLDDGFDARALAGLLARRQCRLKPLLLDQATIAGLGNIYTDEALFRARLHPLRRAGELNWAETKRLHRAIRQVLREAIERSGTSFDWAYPGGRMQHHLRVYHRAGQPCPRCAGKIRVIRVCQRSTHFCPACQKQLC